MTKIILSGFYYTSSNVTETLSKMSFPSIMVSNEIQGDNNWIEEEKWTIYLMGACNIFATALNKKYGYPLYEIKDNDKAVHYCCITNVDGEVCYIDIRGITNMKEIFDRDLNCQNISTNNIKEVSAIEDNHELYDELLEIANKIIEENEEWYNVSLIKKI